MTSDFYNCSFISLFSVPNGNKDKFLLRRNVFQNEAGTPVSKVRPQKKLNKIIHFEMWRIPGCTFLRHRNREITALLAFQGGREVFLEEELSNLANNSNKFLQCPSLAVIHRNVLLGILTPPHIIA